MTAESTFIEMMRAMASDPAARGLLDDTAVIELGDETLILTHDMMAEDVHWLHKADPADVAWKLVSVNLSDLAAKGARPLGVLLGFMLGDGDWDRRFAEGLERVLTHYAVPLLGGDTVSSRGDKRSVGLTAIGAATHRPVPARSGAQAGNLLFVTGTLGDALAGFELAEAELDGIKELSAAYNRPVARLSDGQALAPFVTAMMDISDGLLLDAGRMAAASKVEIRIDVDALPLSAAYRMMRGDGIDSRLQAASWGDDYQLLFTAPADVSLPIAATALGSVGEGSGLALFDAGVRIPLPPSLGYQHH
ncbi:MAG: thiamine-phosphate kinase [Sphingomonadales bacterium]|nr:thiamine-phosphate kinase [Sphingomonadales bacterium]MBK9004161.1 thiamine-phosphate kinase [Sphingomonadales bacterium]MBK9269338.1 thiamine-phosphate kinase [Sphingomonadales bacterium]MBP6434117.1 thiamine-phosphate kinase [Sphingorhabdus sp.]